MTIKYGDVNLGQIEAVLNKIGGEAAIPRLLAGELVVVEREPPTPKPEVPLDTIIPVNYETPSSSITVTLPKAPVRVPSV